MSHFDRDRVFAPDLQCEWKDPLAGDPFPNHRQVLTTLLVAGRIRILNGQTCEQREVISAGPAVRDATTPAIGDLDGDGMLEASNVCTLVGSGGIVFEGRICNRGLRGVGANMPATFYVGDVSAGQAVCQTQTNGPVPVGEGLPITREVPSASVADGSTITMVVNDAGAGARITDECNYVNNTSSVVIDKCMVF